MNKHKAHVALYKKEETNRLKSVLQKYKVIAIADMTNMPSPQLQKLRSSLKPSVLITMSKCKLIKIVFEDLKDKIKGIEKLEEQIKGMPALLLTNDNPFKLAKVLKKSKSMAPAKPGQQAPNDIMILAGPTSFPPGPIMGELGQVGIKTTVVEGKVNIKDDVIIVKEDQVISQQIANILTKLGIEPMEIGINLLAALENGTIFTKDVLSVDEEQFLSNIRLAYKNSFNLTFKIVFPTKQNIKLLLKKAFLESNALAASRKILTSENVKKELANANLQMESLKRKLSLPDDFFKKNEKPKHESNAPKKEIDNKHNKEEEVAQAILKKLQDEKIAKSGGIRKEDKQFLKEEKTAQDVLKKLQDDKIKKEGKK